MSKPLEGKVALVTGGSRGIGAAIAKRLASDGAKVALTYTKSPDAAAAVVQAIQGAGGQARAIQADAADAVAVRAAIETACAHFGALDVLVNNAGIAIPKPFEETSLEEMDQVVAINLRGTFIATQAALKHMQRGARIIMIGSCVGERMMAPGLVAYSATKGAIKMFTQGLAREVGPRGITVNNVQPGPIDTDLNPASGEWAVPQKGFTALDRYGTAEEVAALVAFVASPAGILHHRRQPDRGRRHQRLNPRTARRSGVQASSSLRTDSIRFPISDNCPKSRSAKARSNTPIRRDSVSDDGTPGSAPPSAGTAACRRLSRAICRPRRNSAEFRSKAARWARSSSSCAVSIKEAW